MRVFLFLVFFTDRKNQLRIFAIVLIEIVKNDVIAIKVPFNAFNIF